MEGVDFAFNHPSVAGLVQAGKQFAVRYVGTPTSGKSLSDVEVHNLTSAGIDVVATYETTAGYMLNADGARAADKARAHARMCGMPDGRPIYFALDVDPGGLSSAEWAMVERFLDGAASVIGRNAVGVYGGFAAIERLVPGKARWGWQTYGWSHNRWSSKAKLIQYRNGVALAGGTVDLCASKTTDFGQWGIGPSTLEDDMPLSTDDIDEIKTAMRLVLNEGTGPGQKAWPGTSAATLKVGQDNYNKLNALTAAVAALDVVDEQALAVALLPSLVAGLSPGALAVALAPLIPQPDGAAFLDALRAELND